MATTELALQIIEMGKKKKPALPRSDIKYVQVEEGLCVQMLHIGTYEDEQHTFAVMNDFCEQNKLYKISDRHHEIYINAPRKTALEKVKELLRYQVLK